MPERNQNSPPPATSGLDQVDLQGQPMPEQLQSLDPNAVPERWERTKGLPEEEDDNFPPTSDEALPDEREEKLIRRDLLGKDITRADDE